MQEYGPIQDDYLFFQGHSTEAEQDRRAYAAALRSFGIGSLPLRMLDFGCGDATFTADLLASLRLPPDRLRLEMVEPDEACRRHAFERVRPFTAHPVSAHASLPAGRAAAFDLIVSNHALYYVPDLAGAVAALLRALAPGGLFVTAMGGRRNAWIQFWEQCFAWLGRPIPYHTSEELEAAFSERGVACEKSDVRYEVAFPDTEQNRLRICRFLLGEHLREVPRGPMLALFDRYRAGDEIRMSVVHEHFVVAQPVARSRSWRISEA